MYCASIIVYGFVQVVYRECTCCFIDIKLLDSYIIIFRVYLTAHIQSYVDNCTIQAWNDPKNHRNILHHKVLTASQMKASRSNSALRIMFYNW